MISATATVFGWPTSELGESHSYNLVVLSMGIKVILECAHRVLREDIPPEVRVQLPCVLCGRPDRLGVRVSFPFGCRIRVEGPIKFLIQTPVHGLESVFSWGLQPVKSQVYRG